MLHDLVQFEPISQMDIAQMDLSQMDLSQMDLAVGLPDTTPQIVQSLPYLL